MSGLQQVKTKHNLPRADHFVGRERDVQRVIDALNSRAWIISIDGIGGIGKSALALQVAHRLKEQAVYSGTVWVSAKASWLTPSGIESHEPLFASVDDLLHEVMHVAGLEEFYGESFEQRKTRVENLFTTSEPPYLLIIDNLDTVSDTRIRAFLEFLGKREAGETKAIVTSRESTSAGEYVIKLDGLTDDESIELMQYEAGRDSRLQFLKATSRDTLAEIAHACAGLPLALKWTVARLAQSESSVAIVLGELKDIRGDVLQYIFGSILRTLSTEARDALFAVPAFSTTVSRLMFEDVLQAPAGSKQIASALRELRSLYLIEVDPRSMERNFGGERFRILPATNLCIRAIWEEKPGLDAYFLTRATNYYQKFWKRFSLQAGAGQLDDDYENTKYLLDWSFNEGQWNRVIDLASSLEPYMRVRGLLSDRLTVAYLGLRAASYESNAKQSMKFRESIGKVHKQRGEYQEAEQLFRECLTFYKDTVQSQDEAGIRMQLGIILEHQAEYSIELPPEDLRKRQFEEALSHYSEAYSVFHQLDDKDREAQTLHLIGRVLRHLGRLDESEDKLLASIRLKKESGNLVGVAITEHELARLRHIQGKLDEATSLYQQAIATLTAHGATKDAANAKWRYSQLLAEMGQTDEAEELNKEAVEGYRQQGRWVKHKLASRDLESLIVQTASSSALSDLSQTNHTVSPSTESAPAKPKVKSSPANPLRLQQLADNIRQDMELLKEYEDTVRYETDPRRRAKYRREIEKLNASATSYQNEFAELSMVQLDESALQGIALQLEQMTAKLVAIDRNVADLQQAIVSRFRSSEQEVIASVIQELSESEINDVQMVFARLEANEISERDQAELLSTMQQLLAELKKSKTAITDPALMDGINRLENVIEAPKIDFNHAINVSIPLIPAVLSYTAKIDLGTGANLRGIWQRLVGKRSHRK